MAKPIIDQLAHALGRRDEKPNTELAERIIKAGDKPAIKELISLLDHKSTAVRHDAIKVLYEAGDRKPEFIIGYYKEFLKALDHKDNRMKWSAMITLSVISNSNPEILANHLPVIVKAMDQGSVITRDHGIIILANVSKMKIHHADCMELLLEQIEKAPVNQVPMYAEKTSEVITAPYMKRFEKILHSRKDVLEIPSKQKRIEKLLKQIIQ